MKENEGNKICMKKERKKKWMKEWRKLGINGRTNEQKIKKENRSYVFERILFYIYTKEWLENTMKKSRSNHVLGWWDNNGHEKGMKLTIPVSSPTTIISVTTIQHGQ